jgi:4-hydroxy-3-polyprenylbenzoate decarboxylase
MGEYSGYLSPGGGTPKPVFHVSALTYRSGAILPVVAAGEPVEENHSCWAIAVSAQLLWELKSQGLPVTMCFSPLESAGHWLVVTVSRAARQRWPTARLLEELSAAIFRSRAGRLIPKIFVLEDDIDPTNLDEVVWAIATRLHPAHAPTLYRQEKILPLVAYLTPDERRTARGTKAVYNCLPADDLPASETTCRSSFRFAWPAEIQQRVLDRPQTHLQAGQDFRCPNSLTRPRDRNTITACCRAGRRIKPNGNPPCRIA